MRPTCWVEGRKSGPSSSSNSSAAPKRDLCYSRLECARISHAMSCSWTIAMCTFLVSDLVSLYRALSDLERDISASWTL